MTEDKTKTERIRELNDNLRSTFDPRLGRVVITRGIAALSETERAEIIAAVMEFEVFTEANDPHQEHDFAAIEVAGQTIMFKIDYYDQQMKFLSPDPSDPNLTRRVLTILLAREY